MLCGRYFLRRFIGSGGTAEVYLAWDRIRSTRMAVKVLRPQVDKKALELFEKEAELLRQLEHPFIVRRYEMERHDNLVFLVMDWVEGNNLRQRILEMKRPYSLQNTVDVLQAICSALSFTHQNHVFHCDIKPANILLHVDGRVLLTDFGVARLASEKRSGGTPAYMAPEQILERDVNERTDIYALGVTLYEMLSGGVMPFRGDSQNSQGSTQRERIEWEHCFLPAPPLSQYNPGLPPRVVRVVQQALSKDPTERQASALELLGAFEQACDSSSNPHVESNLPAPQPDPQPYPRVQQAEIPPIQIEPPGVEHVIMVPSSAYIGGPHLFCKAGQYSGQIIPIASGKMSIGRSRDSRLWLGERTVSRSHANILRTRRAVYIEDENSSMGTYVNGERILGPCKLRSGDVIVIGSGQIFEFRER
jgi:serine/threonine protein kinase